MTSFSCCQAELSQFYGNTSSQREDCITSSWNMRCLLLQETSRQPRQQQWDIERPHTSLSSHTFPSQRCCPHLSLLLSLSLSLTATLTSAPNLIFLVCLSLRVTFIAPFTNSFFLLCSQFFTPYTLCYCSDIFQWAVWHATPHEDCVTSVQLCQ